MSSAWGGHVWYECGKHCTGCQFCAGGLASCTHCGGFEGTLPSECPGEKMTQEQQDAVYAGVLDFRSGEWVLKPSGGVSSHYDGRPGLPETTP